MKTATTVSFQLDLLKERGMQIPDEKKAKEILLDIGYYRLGFYWFPFEIGYPDKKNRIHKFKQNASFDKVIALYYFDHDLRCTLSPYLYRIEVNLRTYIIYTVSNFYKNNPIWFSDDCIVSNKFLESLPSCYDKIRKNDAIKHHHKKYINDTYAPAWKTLEYMTFGDILSLIYNLKNNQLRKKIAANYDIENINVFENYMNTIRLMRNLCAHGHNIYDLSLQKSIIRGPIKNISGKRQHNLTGCLLVILYVLNKISANRANELKEKLNLLFSNKDIDKIRDIIGNIEIDLL